MNVPDEVALKMKNVRQVVEALRAGLTSPASVPPSDQA